MGSIRTPGRKILSEAILPPGWGDWSPDVPNGSNLHVWFWNEHQGTIFGGEFYSGHCEYPAVYIDLCQLPRTPTPTPTWPVDELPKTGSGIPLPPFGVWWMAQAGLALVIAGGILRRRGT